VIALEFRVEKLLVLLLVAVLGAGVGCKTPVVDDHRMVRYRPDAPRLPVDRPSSVDGGTENAAGDGEVEGGADGSGEVVATDDGPSDTEPLEVLRILDRGDRIVIYLRGIPKPEEIKDVIDGIGEVSLPYLTKAVKLAGKTTSQAERLIESLYVDGQIYQHVNVIVVAEDEVYFVQGQVARQGKFPVSGPVTLRQAISEAGGFTPFANRKKVKVIRGTELLTYNAKDIADGKLPDPPILADDIIEVPQKW
jgi:hypothetical protein